MINAWAGFTDKEKADLVAFLKALCARSRSVTIWMPGCDNTWTAPASWAKTTMPLFRAAVGKRRQLTPAGYRAYSMRQMLKRRLEDAGLPHLFSPHSFRVAVTDLPNQNVPLEDVHYLAGPLQPQDHPDLRSQAAARHAQYRGADFFLAELGP